MLQSKLLSFALPLVAFAWPTTTGTCHLQSPEASQFVLDPSENITTSSIAPIVHYFDQRKHNVLCWNFVGKGQFDPYPSIATPAIVVFHPGFESLLGCEPSLKRIAITDDAYFAHSAPVWIRDTNEIFFASTTNNLTGQDHNLQYVSKLSMDLSLDGTAKVTRLQLDLRNTLGGTNYKGKLLFAAHGRNQIGGELAIVDPYPPYRRTTVLNNFYGRQFNSLNDVEVHPVSHAMFFTDSIYGYRHGYRPNPQLPSQVYRFNPADGTVHVVADGFVQANGITFSADGTKAYVTDTGVELGNGRHSSTLPATIYEYDVTSEEDGEFFHHRRVFAYIDSGYPNGLKIDARGNVYVAAGDGVHVFSKRGMLLGKFLLGKPSHNIVFAGSRQLVILTDDEIYLAKIDARGVLPYA
ncbi:calcium-dependent phosphotriesterase [Atractiella rhizophila]|nr:calcium-dependent phosphotriesterase [Atractiella rhizophila]